MEEGARFAGVPDKLARIGALVRKDNTAQPKNLRRMTTMPTSHESERIDSCLSCKTAMFFKTLSTEAMKDFKSLASVESYPPEKDADVDGGEHCPFRNH